MTNEKLEAALDTLDARLAEQDREEAERFRKQAEKEAAYQRAVEDFKNLRSSEILPAMQRIKEQLEKRKHAAVISTEDDNGFVSLPFVEIRVQPRNKMTQTGGPLAAFILRDNKVFFVKADSSPTFPELENLPSRPFTPGSDKAEDLIVDFLTTAL